MVRGRQLTRGKDREDEAAVRVYLKESIEIYRSWNLYQEEKLKRADKLKDGEDQGEHEAIKDKFHRNGGV